MNEKTCGVVASAGTVIVRGNPGRQTTVIAKPGQFKCACLAGYRGLYVDKDWNCWREEERK